MDKHLKLRIRPSGLFIYSVIHIIGISINHLEAHPQCLDFRPPFASVKPLQFCSNYSDFGCCDHKQDGELEQLYQTIYQQSTSRVDASCQQMLKQVLCLRCSPYAAHVYDAENDGQAAPLPGLCDSFCTEFFKTCSGLIAEVAQQLGVPDSQIQALTSTRDAFCDVAQTGDVDYCYPDLLTNPIINGEINRTISTTEGCLCLEQFASDLRNPIIFRHFPDGSGNILVGEQIGVVHVYSRSGSKIGEFMDLSQIVLTSTRPGDERGLLGIAFHPDFSNNYKFYCYFSVSNNGEQYVQINELKANPDDKNKMDESYEKEIIKVKQPYWNHNGGAIHFGVDGYLYLFLGDGGSAGDPHNYAQDRTVLLGKVLRLDINVGDEQAYAIPPDNPYANSTTFRPEIYCYGVRNMWRCDVDEGDPMTGYGRGRIICGDVGQDAYEEIDIIEKGGNFGWNGREGFECFKQDVCNQLGPEVLPIFAYPHSQGKSITGGHVYRGCQNPALNGLYIYGDYTTGKVYKLDETILNGESLWIQTEINMCGSDVCFNGLVNTYERRILSFGEDENGEVYMLTTSNAITNRPHGSVYKIVDPRRRGDPSTCRSWPKPSASTSTPNPSTSTATSTLQTSTATTRLTTTQNPWLTSDANALESALLKHIVSTLLVCLVILQLITVLGRSVNDKL